METKTFLILWGAVFTIAILSGMYFVGTFLSTQQFKQFEASQNESSERFTNSVLIHDFLFDNITDLKKSLDPILEQIPDAKQSKIDQDRHYNQSNELDKILRAMGNNTQIVEQNKQEHDVLLNINKSLEKIVNGLDIANDPLL
jgi:hypothetical protein